MLFKSQWLSVCLVHFIPFFLFFFWCQGVEFGILGPQPGSNPCPLQWKHIILTTGPPGKSLVPFRPQDVKEFQLGLYHYQTFSTWYVPYHHADLDLIVFASMLPFSHLLITSNPLQHHHFPWCDFATRKSFFTNFFFP